MIFDNAVFIKPDIKFNREMTYENNAPMFRKKFYTGNTKDAKLFVCGLGYAYYYINGKKVTDDLFTAPVSNYLKTLWYNVYDVSELLCEGENTIAVICGNGWYNESLGTSWNFDKVQWRDNPKFILKLDVGGETALVSDASWKCNPDSAIYFNELRLGEYFDANLYDENWTMPSFDDSSWKNALRDTTPPVGKFRECRCEPIRECRVYDAVNCTKLGEKRYIFDFGQNMSGYVRLTASDKCGKTLNILYGERVDENGEIDFSGMDSYFTDKGFQTDKFICSSKEVTWSPLFTYHGFRYIEIDGITDINHISVQAVFVHQDIERRTSFECSDEFLTRMYNAGVMSSYSNMFYMLTDCPTREKLGWTNDAQSSAEQMLINFKTEKLFAKWLQDIRDAMLSDGALPGIIPSSGWGYHWGNGPVSDGILFELPYRIYLHTGDSSHLIENLPYFDRYLRHLDDNKNEDGLVSFGLDDWAAPKLMHFVETEFVNAVLEYSFIKIAHLAARLAGCDNADRYSEKAGKQKNLIINRYIDANGRCTIHEQCSVAMLIYYDITDNIEPLKQQLAETLEVTGFHLKCGMVGLRRLLLALNKCGLAEYAYKLLTVDGYPGYKVWFDGDATTLWEKWDVNINSDSKNHHMYSDFMSWLIKTVAGISLNEEKCGELEFVLKPIHIEAITSAKLCYNTVCGTIELDWIRENGKTTLRVNKEAGVKLVYNGKMLADGESVIEF